MYHITARVTVFMVLFGGTTAFAQSLPTSQPNVLTIFREEVKIGHDADHVKTEAAFVSMMEKAKFPYSGIALVSLTGPPEAWFINPFDSHAALGDFIKRQTDDPGLSEWGRLARADGEHVSSGRSIHAVARKDLSRGAFPDAGKQRFYEITVFRVRPRHEGEFAAAGQADGTAAGRPAPPPSYPGHQGA